MRPVAPGSIVRARIVGQGLLSALVCLAASGRAQVLEPLPPAPLLPQAPATPASPAGSVVVEKDATPAKPVEAKERVGGNVGLDALFLRGSSTHVQGGGVNVRDGFGFTVGSELWATASQRWLTFHYDYDALLGGGGNGLEGLFAMRGALGVRVPVSASFGPYARIGLGGDYQGNDWYAYSHFDAPLGQLGAAFVRKGYSVEAGGQVAYTAGGRYITGVASRRVLDGAPTAGGYAEVQLLPVLLRGEYTEYAQGGTGTPLSAWITRGCVVFPSIEPPAVFPVDVCFDGTWLSGGVVPPGAATAETSDVFYFGVSIGLGVMAASARFKDVAPKHPPVERATAPTPP